MDPQDKYFMDQTVLRKGIIQNFECTVKYKNEDHILYVSATLIEVNGQKVVLRSSINVTDKKKLEYQLRESEAKLKEYNQQLEQIVKERTLELATTLEHLKATNEELLATNEELYSHREQLEDTLNRLQDTQNQLIQTEKMASLGILTAGIAHEINNPINYIFNGSQAIQNYIKDHLQEHTTELMPYFEAINTGIDRTVSIVRNLNRYSGYAAEKKAHCDMHHILENVLAFLSNQLQSKIEIIKNYYPGSLTVEGTESKLNQAFLNILLNAVQSIEKTGTITLITSLEKEQMIIRILDTGCGISSEDLRHIFDPFFTTKDPGKGTGLGLSISQSIIHEHGGIIECKSKRDSGSEFIVTLPVIRIV
jgi:two-component system, NtrC family, sensor kinase